MPAMPKAERHRSAANCLSRAADLRNEEGRPWLVAPGKDARFATSCARERACCACSRFWLARALNDRADFLAGRFGDQELLPGLCLFPSVAGAAADKRTVVRAVETVAVELGLP